MKRENKEKLLEIKYSTTIPAVKHDDEFFAQGELVKVTTYNGKTLIGELNDCYYSMWFGNVLRIETYDDSVEDYEKKKIALSKIHKIERFK